MKISKLFHWLYAFLMLLPIAFLVPNIFYYAFNDNATNSHIETTTINYKYETNEVNSEEDLVIGNLYHFQLESDSELHTINTYFKVLYIKDLQIFVESSDYDVDINFNLSNYESTDTFFTINESSNTFGIETSVVSYGYYEFVEHEYSAFNFDCIAVLVNIRIDNLNVDLNTLISECPQELIPIESVETTTLDLDIVDSIENNLRKTWDLSLFSWTHNNIIIQPFSYLCGLFGMSNNSIIAYYLDYWVCISVIYLVFDLVMYVPLLAHKWIDKAKVE